MTFKARQLHYCKYLHCVSRLLPLWVLLRSHRPAGRNSEVFPKFERKGGFVCAIKMVSSSCAGVLSSLLRADMVCHFCRPGLLHGCSTWATDERAWSLHCTAAVVHCRDCQKPRLIYSLWKLSFRQQLTVSTAVSEGNYTCGCLLLSPDHSLTSTISVSLAPSCGDPGEVAFYSQEFAGQVCVHTVVESRGMGHQNFLPNLKQCCLVVTVAYSVEKVHHCLPIWRWLWTGVRLPRTWLSWLVTQTEWKLKKRIKLFRTKCSL